MKIEQKPGFNQFIETAPCRKAESYMFDAVDKRTASEGLRYCGVCRVVDECYAQIDPRKNWYDGIAAQTVWYEGRPVFGKHYHSRGEKCDLCHIK